MPCHCYELIYPENGNSDHEKHEVHEMRMAWNEQTANRVGEGTLAADSVRFREFRIFRGSTCFFEVMPSDTHLIE